MPKIEYFLQKKIKFFRDIVKKKEKGNPSKRDRFPLVNQKGSLVRWERLFTILYIFLYIFVNMHLSEGNEFFCIRIPGFCIPHQVQIMGIIGVDGL